MELPPLQILFEDNHCIAIAKPPGALTTGYEGGEETLDRQVKAYLKEKFQKPGNVFLGVVHRLDRPVSGVLLYARTSKAAARLAEQFREGTTTKLYWAIVHGRMEPESGLLEDWLCKDYQTGIVEVRASNDPLAKLARLEYRCLNTQGNVSWIEVKLLTGRTHQIRVQFASRGHPVLGDAKYGSTLDLSPCIALHARSLTVLHPIRYEPMTLCAPLPAAWERFRTLGVPSQ